MLPRAVYPWLEEIACVAQMLVKHFGSSDLHIHECKYLPLPLSVHREVQEKVGIEL